jgi:hypothetical protein
LTGTQSGMNAILKAFRNGKAGNQMQCVFPCAGSTPDRGTVGELAPGRVIHRKLLTSMSN